MCLATPMELKRIEGEWGFIEHDDHEHKVTLSLIENPKVSDWLTAHGELAVNRISQSEAKDILKLIGVSNHSHAQSN